MDKTLQFKTNINCSGCVARVKPILDQEDGICHWTIDTTSPERILTVHSKGITEGELSDLLAKKGFQIEEI
jgi:copper chaperone